MPQYPVLILEEKEGVPGFREQRVSLDAIPQTINGESGHHVLYVRILTEHMARQLGKMGYAFTEAQIQAMALASSLHDIGKLQVPRSILEKTSALTPEEYDIVKTHAPQGSRLIAKTGRDLPAQVREYAMEIARHHHERFDGKGYPDGLAGSQIPVAAQIVSIADAYEALITERSYKQALSQQVALEMIAEGRCGVFDPQLVACLVQVLEGRPLP